MGTGFFRFVIMQSCDGRTERQNYDFQDRASIAASRGKSALDTRSRFWNHGSRKLAPVSVAFHAILCLGRPACYLVESTYNSIHLCRLWMLDQGWFHFTFNGHCCLLKCSVALYHVCAKCARNSSNNIFSSQDMITSDVYTLWRCEVWIVMLITITADIRFNPLCVCTIRWVFCITYSGRNIVLTFWYYEISSRLVNWILCYYHTVNTLTVRLKSYHVICGFCCHFSVRLVSSHVWLSRGWLGTHRRHVLSLNMLI